MTLQHLFLLTDNSPPEYNDFISVMVIVLNTFSLKRSVMQLFYFIKTPLLLLILWSCNKDKTDFSNITLKDKPLSQIKTAIRGKWQLHYSYGGITGNIRHNYTSSFLEFKANDSLYWDDNNNRIVADRITWENKTDVIGDKTYIMSFCEMRSSVCYSYSWGVQGIRNDTLILYDNATDPDYHYLTKK
jgi:hypothetical protein